MNRQLMLIGLGIAISLIFFDKGIPFSLGSKPLYYASQFLSDWSTGLFIGFSIWIMPDGTSAIKSIRTDLVRKVADLTFAVYLLHYPLLIAWDSLFYYKIKNVSQIWQPLFTVLAVALLIGLLLEKSRYLWSNLFKYIFLQSNFLRNSSMEIFKHLRFILGK